MSCTCSLVSKTNQGAGNFLYVFACQKDGTFHNVTVTSGNDNEAKQLAELECDELNARAATPRAEQAAASEAAQAAMQSFFELLAGFRTQEAGRLFFPQGIDAIRFKAEVSLSAQTKVALEFEVRGPATGPIPPAPASEEVGQELAPAPAASPQDIIAECQAEFPAHKADCSGFAKAVAAHFGVKLTGQANDIVDQMQQAAWTQLADGVAAKAKADAGWLVLGALKGSELANPENNGHVVVVVSGALVNGKPIAYWGRLNGVGEQGQSVSKAWRAVDLPNVHYAARQV